MYVRIICRGLLKYIGLVLPSNTLIWRVDHVVWTCMYPWLQAESNPAPHSFYWWRNWSFRKTKWLVQLHTCERGSSSSIFQQAMILWPEVKLFRVMIFKTHYKTQLSLSPCNSVSKNEEILSFYWNQPSNIQVSSSQRSYLTFCQSCLERKRLAVPPEVGLSWQQG